MDLENFVVDESLWTDRKGKYWSFHCPNCKVERRISSKPNPYQFKYVFRVLLLTAVTMIPFWTVYGGHGVLFFLPYWIGFEILFRLKIRGELVCDRCGFDPVLFMRDSKLARAAIEKFWSRRFKELGIESQSDASQASEADQVSSSDDSELNDDAEAKIEEAGLELNP